MCAKLFGVPLISPRISAAFAPNRPFGVLSSGALELEHVASMNMITNQIRIASVAAAVVSLCMITGCKSESKSVNSPSAAAERAGSTPATKKPGVPIASNTLCPIMVDHPVRKNLDQSLTRQYKGQLIGFCCSDCPEAWDALSGQEKDQALADAAKAAADIGAAK